MSVTFPLVTAALPRSFIDSIDRSGALLPTVGWPLHAIVSGSFPPALGVLGPSVVPEPPSPQAAMVAKRETASVVARVVMRMPTSLQRFDAIAPAATTPDRARPYVGSVFDLLELRTIRWCPDERGSELETLVQLRVI